MTAAEQLLSISSLSTGTASEHLLSVIVGSTGWNAAEKNAIIARVDELHKIHGLSAGNPMTVTPSSRTVTGITQNITGDGETTTTVSRA